jgi:hypothetical protein
MKLLRFLVPGLLAALAVASGCDTKANPKGQVSGRVLLNGQPVPAGSVQFVGADGNIKGATIARDGTYAVTGLAPGLAKIGVEYNPPNGGFVDPKAPRGRPSATSEPTPKPVPIPLRYRDPAKSGLTHLVTPGEKPHDIELRP